MYYLDTHRTITRRESSLITKRQGTDGGDGFTSTRAQSTTRLTSDSGSSIVTRQNGSIQKELVTSLFESMLDHIVLSWEVIVQYKEESNIDIGKTPSETTFTKKKRPAIKSSKTKKSRSKLDILDAIQDPMMLTWWSAPDEKVVIRFRNGNLYEGNISMKCMNGEGRFQWADGTIYMGSFQDNEVKGKGMIQWKDDTWYEGDFAGNIRHGKGLYVDSRRQRSYTGGWHCGTKHGKGVMFYTKTMKNSYDGDWVYNVRHGYGAREYCPLSGYQGKWDLNVREGRGIMIWPNHDFYRGEWKNGLMSGHGMYIWDTYYNNSMSVPSLNAYRGFWSRGLRNGYGTLNLGFNFGAHYKGEFKNNNKHGPGKFVTCDGLILQDNNLFINDNMCARAIACSQKRTSDANSEQQQNEAIEPCQFNICDYTTGLLYHVEQAINNIDRQEETRLSMINEFIEYNKGVDNFKKDEKYTQEGICNIMDLIDFEEISLRKAIRCFETELKDVYYKYAKICNTEEISFMPILIRLYLWQLYYDCNIHEKGLTLVETDRIFHRNPEWLSETTHNPFEKIYFWQFSHCLIAVASRLYAKRQLPGPKPDTILAGAFRTFMEQDVIPSSGKCKGRLSHGYGQFVPLKSLYALYRSLGEPHTVRTFLCAVRRPPHWMGEVPPPLVEAPDENVHIGRNVYIFGDEMIFVTEKEIYGHDDEELERPDLKLFNFSNLSSKTIIKIFGDIFPGLCGKDKVYDLEIQITFFEFFEVFLACAEESIRVKEEELRWRDKFSESSDGGMQPIVTMTTTFNKTK